MPRASCVMCADLSPSQPTAGFRSYCQRRHQNIGSEVAHPCSSDAIDRSNPFPAALSHRGPLSPRTSRLGFERRTPPPMRRRGRRVIVTKLVPPSTVVLGRSGTPGALSRLPGRCRRPPGTHGEVNLAFFSSESHAVLGRCAGPLPLIYTVTSYDVRSLVEPRFSSKISCRFGAMLSVYFWVVTERGP